METIKLHGIKWNVHHANDIKTNPIDFIFCIQGNSTRESMIRVYKVMFQYPVDEKGYTLYYGDISKAEYYILNSLTYTKMCEDYDPYSSKWYLNYTSVDMIASDYNYATVFKSLKDIEDRINDRTNELAYMLSYIADSIDDAKESASKNKILDIKAHKSRYNGYASYLWNEKEGKTLEDIAWYFNEFHTSTGILSTKIEDNKIKFRLDRSGRVEFQLKGDNGYIQHWRNYGKKDTLYTATTECAYDAVMWLLQRAYHTLPIMDKYEHYSR